MNYRLTQSLCQIFRPPCVSSLPGFLQAVESREKPIRITNAYWSDVDNALAWVAPSYVDKIIDYYENDGPKFCEIFNNDDELIHNLDLIMVKRLHEEWNNG